MQSFKLDQAERNSRNNRSLSKTQQQQDFGTDRLNKPRPERKANYSKVNQNRTDSDRTYISNQQDYPNTKTTRSRSNQLDLKHPNSNDQQKKHRTEEGSWQEKLKEESSDNESYLSFNNQHRYSKRYGKKPVSTGRSHQAIMPASTTMKSIAATSLGSNKKNNRQKQSGCFSCCCKTTARSRITVFIVFFLCISGAVTAFFCWPRTPRVAMGGGSTSLSGAPDWWGVGDNKPPPDTPLPARPLLSAVWQMNITLDNRDNWIPTRLNQLDFVLVDSLTLAKFAWASTTAPIVLPPKEMTPISVTFSVSYQAVDHTDPTFQNLYKACGPLSDPNQQRQALNVLMRVSFHIFGIRWVPLVTATPYTGGIICPTS